MPITSGPIQEDTLTVNKDCHTVRVEPGRASEIHTALSAFSAGFHNFTNFFAKHNVTRGPFVLVNLTAFFSDKEAQCSNITLRTDMSYSLKKVNQSHYRPQVPRGFQEVKVRRLRDNGPGWR